MNVFDMDMMTEQNIHGPLSCRCAFYGHDIRVHEWTDFQGNHNATTLECHTCGGEIAYYHVDDENNGWGSQRSADHPNIDGPGGQA